MTAEFPVFVMQVRPVCVPSELEKLPKHTFVRYEYHSLHGRRGIGVEKAIDVIKTIQDTIDRQGNGFFTADEAAFVLAESLINVSPEMMLKTMFDAARNSKLVIRHADTQLPIAPTNDLVFAYAHVRIADIDTWLETQGVDYRFPEAQKKPVKSDDAIDYSALATRQQLISAFGAFTGMDKTWFQNLKDKPKLQRACKVTGQGQRSHTVEPMFCPYEVMQWLIDPKRKKGKPLLIETGWKLLGRHFENVYNQQSVNDPREAPEG
jgi:hypothetical protein